MFETDGRHLESEAYQGGNSPGANSVEDALSALSNAPEAPSIIIIL